MGTILSLIILAFMNIIIYAHNNIGIAHISISFIDHKRILKLNNGIFFNYNFIDE